MSADIWVAIGAISAALYTITFAVSMNLLRRQFREMKLTRQTELLMALYDRLIRSRPGRREILANADVLKRVSTLSEWDELRQAQPDLENAVAEVSMDYHLVGLFLIRGLLDDERVFLDDIGEVFLSVLEVIRRAIELERQRSGKTYRRGLDELERRIIENNGAAAPAMVAPSTAGPGLPPLGSPG